MKKILLLAAAAVLAAASPALAQWQGVAEFRITTNTSRGDSIPGTGKIYVAPGAYRMEMDSAMAAPKGKSASAASATPGPRLKVVLFGKLSDPDHITMLDDANRTYSVWDVKKARDESKDAPRETYTVKKLGTDTVAGLSCQKAEVTSANGTVIAVCLAKDFAVSSDWLAALQRRQREGSAWLAALKDNGLSGFPARIAMTRKGADTPFMTMTLTRLEKGDVAAAMFEIPEGYKQTELALGGLSPEQQKAVADARAHMKDRLDKMTPEQRKAYEDAIRRYQKPTPSP